MHNLSPLQSVNHPLFVKHNISVQIKRDDLIHPIISGNKWRKLKYNLQQAQRIGAQGILTFGGCFSNHIHASAFACQQQHLTSIGVIRGEFENQNNYTLNWAKHWGMQLNFVDRKTYRLRHDTDYLETLQARYPHFYLVPEGGSNELAIPGMAEVIDELALQTTFDTILTPVGSGGTIAGLIAADNNEHNILGVAVLKQDGYLADSVTQLLPVAARTFNNWKILKDYHCGGYAKFSNNDAQQIRAFSKQTGINCEPVYSGKMILALLHLIEQGHFPAGHRIVLLHTGGMQGLAGMFSRGKLKVNEWPSLPVPPAL
jgi:1-aminocyclopropane-1-carboxylate deaminase